MSHDPKINMITTCWRHLRHIDHPSVPSGASPPRLQILISTIAGIYRLEANVSSLGSQGDQLAYVHNYILINNLAHHKLQHVDKVRIAAGRRDAVVLTRQEKARQKEPFLSSGPTPALISVPIKKLTKKQRRAERERRKAEREAASKARPVIPAAPKDKRAEFNAWVNSVEFLKSYEWRKVRYAVVVRCKGRCEACGAGKEQDIVLHVDHIKPRRKYPHLALEPLNLQGLCGPCNHGKGNWDETDWRTPAMTPESIPEESDETDRDLKEAFLNAMAAE